MQESITVIKPRTSLLKIDFKEIWAYRDLLALFVKRNIITQYKQTILGPLWFVIQPALTTMMYMVVFGGIAGIPTDGVPQPLFYLAGICCWQYFADCLTKTSNVFVDNQALFGKVYFPRIIVPMANVTSNLVKMGVQIVLFVAVYLYYALFQASSVAPNIYILFLPVFILMLAGLSFGFGIIISSLTTKYRDLQVLFTFVVQLWMYATPIVYPLSMIRNEKLALVMSLNPITPIVEAFKYVTLGVGVFSWNMVGYSMIFLIVLLSTGLVIFNKVQKSFMDTV